MVHRVVTLRTRKILYTLLIFFALLSVRLLFIQLGSAKSLSKIASDQYKTFASILPKRGIIYDSNLRKLAISINLDSVFVDPFIVEDKDAAALKISDVLNLKKSDVLKKMGQRKRFVWLARKIDPKTERALKRLNIKGIGFIKESICFSVKLISKHTENIFFVYYD